jgi:hypothetical protein
MRRQALAAIAQALTLALALALGCIASACGGGLELRRVLVRIEKPARVIVLYSVETEEGGVPGLGRPSFTLEEDGRPAAPGEWDFANPDLRARQHTVLLVDLGGGPSPADRASIGAAARIFAESLAGAGTLAIYAFDGAPLPQLIAAPAERVPEDAFKRLETFESRDHSTDLHGAYRTAFDALAAELDKAGLGVGTIVLVTRGPDRAARVRLGDLDEHMREAPVVVARHVVGVGPEAQQARLGPLATTKPLFVEDALALSEALRATAERVKAFGLSYYLVSYCSPARAGQHRLEITASRTLPPVDGKKPVTQTGKLRHRFDADGFGGGCDPTIPADWRGAPR